jgi:hypothetical protein
MFKTIDHRTIIRIETKKHLQCHFSYYQEMGVCSENFATLEKKIIKVISFHGMIQSNSKTLSTLINKLSLSNMFAPRC